ncbi:MAG: DUF5683 domain-containing protein [Bacteroidales bacterium]
MILKRTAEIIILLFLMLCTNLNIVAQDTTAVNLLPVNRIKDPHRATMLAAALPGMGQVYNRKYWKIPLVYAGFAGLGYSVWFNTSTHIQYTRAYQDFTDIIPETNSYLDLIKGADPSTYDPVLHPDSHNPSQAQWVRERLLSGIDYYKKYRDLSYIGIAAWYLISILDANVDASLSDYDIGETLNLSFLPTAMPAITGNIYAFNLRLVKTF